MSDGDRLPGRGLSEVAAKPRPLGYNPSLDGIRALAVSAVLLYHGGATTGGFLGVDMFFVLSGFLICSLLIAEMDATGSVNLGRFWGRRARRLVPALLAVALFVVLALPFLVDDLPASLPWDALTSVTYTSNWWYIANGQAYASGTPTPLLHSWSLAIEEQWYLVFPLLLLGLALVFRRRLGTWLGPVLLAGAAVSALWTAWLAHTGASVERVYFGTDTRVQALLIGASLAAFLALPREAGYSSELNGDIRRPAGTSRPTEGSGRPEGQRWRGAFGWLALGALVVMFVSSSVSSPWLPRGGFLVVAVFSALLILSVAPRPAPWSPAPLLASPPLVAVGLISYGLYLWHFPVYLWLTPDRVGLVGWPLLVLRVTVTVALAIASYVAIERPIRQGGGWAGSPVSWRRVLPVAAVAGLAFVVGIIRLPAPSSDSLVALQSLATSPPTPDTEGSLPTPRMSPATGGPTGATPSASSPSSFPAPSTKAPDPTSSASTNSSALPPGPVGTVLIVGDSVALSVLPAARAAGGPVINIATRFGCGTVPFTAVVEGLVLKPEEPLCSDWEKARSGEIAAQPADLGILYLGPWEQYDRWVDGEVVSAGSPEWLEETAGEYRRVLEEMEPHVKRLAVVLNHCHGAPDTGLPVEAMYRAGRYAPVVNDEQRIAYANAAAKRAVEQLGAPVEVIDPGSLLCEGGYREEISGVRLHTDGVHFSEEGAAMLWAWLSDRLSLEG